MTKPSVKSQGFANRTPWAEAIREVPSAWLEDETKKSPSPYSLLSSWKGGRGGVPAHVIVFWLIALAQLLRIILRVRVTAGSHEIPFWLSAVAFVVLGALGMWLWRERRAERDEL